MYEFADASGQCGQIHYNIKLQLIKTIDNKKHFIKTCDINYNIIEQFILFKQIVF